MSREQEQTINVMLVDDHKSMLWGLEKLIEREFPRMHVVGKAHNRAEAISGANELQPHVIVLDLELDGESGLDFLPELRASGDTRVLVLTGVRDTNTLEYAIIRGACGVVHKASSPEILIKAIECVNRGELWLDRATTARIFDTLTNSNGRPDPEAKKIGALTPKERKVISTIVTMRGAKSHEIAQALYMSDHTLRNHLTAIYSKLGVRNRIELVIYANENKLV
jgi:two-component system, NarL family, nitrate/nitrite response regulator NarL